MTEEQLNHEGAWAKCLKIFRDNLTPQSFKTWFEPISPIKLENKILTIQVPSQFFYEWIEEHYVDLLQKTLRKVLGPGAKLEYNIIVENSNASKIPYTVNLPTSKQNKNTSNEVNMPLEVIAEIKNPFVIPGIKRLNINSQLQSRYNFDNFIEGECNRLARSAGFSIAQQPGETAFNPLMIFGGTGLGKTHLVQAIGNQVKINHKNKVVLYIQTGKFTNQYVEACKNNTHNDFINFYQQIDVLIVDDVHELSKKEKTQEIFFQIFNHLHQNGKQIILTSDRPPKDIKDVDERLLSRFKWGLSADIETPDFETRINILENKIYNEGITFTREVIEYIAHNLDNNIRELEGALISLLAQSSLNRKEIDLDLAKQVMKNLVKNAAREISIDFIQKVVCDYYNIDVDTVKSKTRKREIVQARQIAMFFAKDFTKASLKNIGSHFGGRDHSTVIHACQTVNDLIDTDKKFRYDVDELQKRIKINTI
ncbi:MAG: chromosomal replication initiator protein DnaA [Bacteroidia bacterium]|nr:chromosomal replication initiator protein DnaA [Bacteroidia bacterium]MCO5253510.1 chromosomal replication initiator protein DnaA [Bacteroidota bacterium]